MALKDIFDELLFYHRALIAVITLDADSKEVLMMTWINKAWLEKTLATGLMTYWSRNRQYCFYLNVNQTSQSVSMLSTTL